MKPYELTRSVWKIDAADYPADGPFAERARFLLQYAILAPSSHNSQPWEFVIDDSTIEIHAATDRWLDVADQDKRELYLSLGCTLENLCIAAERFDHAVDVAYHDEDEPSIIVTLQPDTGTSFDPQQGLFDQLTKRSTNHHLFRDQPLDDSVRDKFHQCVTETDVTLKLIDDPDQRNLIAEHQAEADRLQMDDPEYRRELGQWIGIGALGAGWLTARIGQTVVTHLDIGGSEAKKNSKLIQSTPVVGVLLTESDAPSLRMKAGRSFERIALSATGEGIAVHPMSQILERPRMREELARLLGEETAMPQHLFRLGYPLGEDDHTPRWPLEKFLVEEQ